MNSFTVKVYGASDDLVEVEGDLYEEFTALGNLDQEDDQDGGYLAFSDGTILKIVYGDGGIWRIELIARGAAEYTLEQAPAEDDANYSDVATLTSAGPFTWVVFGSAVHVNNKSRVNA